MISGKNIFFEELARNLKKNNINYVFMRGHEFIFNNKEHGEIDILIKKSDLNKVRKLFKTFHQIHESKNNIDLTHPFLVKIVGEKFIVDMDFQVDGVGYCGSAILKSDFLLRNKIKKGRYYQLNDKARFMMLLIHGFVFKKRLKYFNKYEKEFFNLFGKLNKKYLFKELDSFFNKSYALKIMNFLEAGNLNGLFGLRGKMVYIHLKNNPKEVPKVLISKLMRFRNHFQLKKIAYFLNPLKWAPLICFIGSDGSGKSTLTKYSEEYLYRFRIDSIRLSGGVFSGLKNPFVSEKTQKSYSEKISSLNKPNSFSLFLRFLLQIPKQAKIAYHRKKGTVVITDRYIYDLVFFYGATGIIKKLTKSFPQKPTFCFYLKVSPKTIFKRNNELDMNAIKSLISRMNSNKDFFSMIEINNNAFKASKESLKYYLEKIIKNV